MSDFLFVPLRTFFCAALAKCWKVQFRRVLHKFSNIDKKKRHTLMRVAVLYIYVYIYGEENIVIVLVPCVDSDK